MMLPRSAAKVSLLLAVAVLLCATLPGHAFRSAFTGSRVVVGASAASSSSRLCMKTIAVFGASGLTGQECVYQALKNGDTVIGLTR